MVKLDNLRRLTYELATEIETEERGPTFDFAKFILENVQSPSAIINTDGNILFQNSSWNGFFNSGDSILEEVGNCELETEDIWNAMERQEVETKFITLNGVEMRKVILPLVFDGTSGSMIILSEVE